MPEDAPGNPGAVPEWADEESGEPDDELVMLGKVRGMQARLHRWAGEDSSRRFGDLHNLVCDPDFVAEAWMRVRGNRGAKTPGIDGVTAAHVERRAGGVSGFLAEIRGTAEGRGIPAVGGPAGDDPEDERETPQNRDTHPGRPGGPGVAQAGPGAHLRGGLPAVLVRVPGKRRDKPAWRRRWKSSTSKG